MVELTAQSRRSISLDGTWQFVTDPDGDGHERGLQDPDADWSDAEDVTVPHAWQEADDYREYTGTAWYRRAFEYDGEGERALLRFGAVDHEATVYVDGHEMGTNREGYLPVEVEVTDHLSPGENTVAVEVTDPAALSEIPHGKQGAPWYTRVSGIWQSVTLEARPGTFVSDVRATPDLDDDTVTVDVTVDGDAGTLESDVAIHKDGRDVVTGTCDLDDGRGSLTLSVPDPTYWTPDRPELYDLTVELRADGDVVDRYNDYFGMRSVSADDKRLYLNGEPLYVRGALDQAYYPDTLYRPFDVDLLPDDVAGDEYATLFEYEIETAKELGFNLLRKHIKPAHPDFVEAADRLGMLVWQEPANPTVYTERSRREVREQFRGMVERDYNSPSVVIWSLYNEEWGIGLGQGNRTDPDHPDRLWNDPEKQDYLTDLYREAKEWDPMRLVCDNSGWAHVATDINDYHEYYASPDRHGAWEDGLDKLLANPGENYGVENTPADDAPVLISEFGTWGFPDLRKFREHYGSDPHWFSHDFLDDPLKRPEGVDGRFAATDLPDVFGDYNALAEAWQTRESVSLHGVIEEMRTRDAVAGYVVTEFSDIEWEFNGVLDYLREPKSFADEFARLNDDLLVSVDPGRHVVAPGEEVPVDVHVVNDTGEALSGELDWTAPGADGARETSVEGFGTTTFEAVATVAPPADADTGPATVTVTFDAGDRAVTGTEPVFVVAAEPVGDRRVYADDALAGAFAERHPVVEAVDDADVAVVTEVTDAVSAFVEGGGRAVIVPGSDGRMAASETFDYRNLPTADSWNLVASLLYGDSDLLADLCPDARIGWAFEDLFPYDLVDDLSESDDLHAGSVEGWIANWSSPLVVRDHGDGQLCACTFRVTDDYGDHPTATVLLDRLISTV